MFAVTSATPTNRGSIAAQLPQLRAALEQQRVFRAEQLTDFAVQAAKTASTVDDSRDEVTDTLRAGAAAALADTEAAIARMTAGTYGTCDTCGDPIPLERLEILPMAASCMPCARVHETRTR